MSFAKQEGYLMYWQTELNKNITVVWFPYTVLFNVKENNF